MSDASLARTHPRDVLLAIAAVILVDTYLLSNCAALAHWLIIFPSISGVWLLSYTLGLVRRVDVLDPVLFVSAFLLWQVFLNPLLQVYWDAWLNYEGRPPDMRDWLGYLSLINFAGLILFFIGVRRGRALPTATMRMWTLDRRRFYRNAFIALMFGCAMYAVVLKTYGGLAGIVKAQDDRIGQGAANNPFKGEGSLTVLTEFVPQLLGIVLIVWGTAFRGVRTIWFAGAVLFATAALALIFGGLRGSRATVVFALLSVGGAVHYCVYRFRVRHVLAGAVVIVVFMNIFFYYKRGGLEGLKNVSDAASRDRIEEKVGGYDSMYFTLLDDFGRADAQSLALYRVVTSDVPRAWGRSYMAALAQPIPHFLWKTRPEGFKKERTELLFGRGAFDANPDNYVPWIFGMPGELMVNFGWIAAPLAFLILGFGAGALQGRIRVWLATGDARLLLALTMTSQLLLFFHGDSHLYLQTIMKTIAISYVVVGLSSRRVVRQA